MQTHDTNQTLGAFEVLPFSRTCQIIWEEGDHVLIGVSPGNSYFNAERIAELADWAQRRFAEIDFVYADLHVEEMFAAFGYSREHAARRAAKELKAVRRRLVKGVGRAGPPEGSTRVRGLSEFGGNPVYQLQHRRVRHFMEHDDAFRKGCEDMVRYFLEAKVGDGEAPSEWQRRVCLDYIAAELPFFVDTPGILGVPSSVAAYHTVMPLTEVLYARGGGLRATRNQAYAVVRPEGLERPEGGVARAA
ncbi:tRNA-dependent cyclodipeptide synthase [Streptomyces sp. E11-3]|uniref:tRNA-dependent cyclodipeptide synthase n=1 Tax=Streptomyces sp. E11-3 TaxID=3110112 RepID=UPI00397F8ED4